MAREDDPETWALRTVSWKDFDSQNAEQVGEYREFVIYRIPAECIEQCLRAINLNGNVVGGMLYWASGSGNIDGSVAVNPDFRRRGIASALCRKAEELSGKVLRSTLLTPDGKSLWGSPWRNFGGDQQDRNLEQEQASRQTFPGVDGNWGEWFHLLPTAPDACPPDWSISNPRAFRNSECAYLNRWYVVTLFEFPCKWGDVIQASVVRKDEARITWAELQRIKNELFGRERLGIEVLPPESELVDQENAYHFWILPEGGSLPFGLHLPGAFGAWKDTKAGEHA